MKAKIKENALWLVGMFFIYIVPVIMLVVEAIAGSENKQKPSLWVIVALIIVSVAYYVGGRKLLRKKKEKDYDKVGYVYTWIRVLDLLVFILPFTALFIAVDVIRNASNDTFNEILVFLGATIGSIVVGYLFLIADSRNKEKKALENKDKKE